MFKYEVAAEMLPELEKKIKAITKKLDKYGVAYNYEKGEAYAKRIGIYDKDPELHTLVKVADTVTQVIPYTFEMTPLKLGNWIPVARIEHDAVAENNPDVEFTYTVNVVHLIDESFDYDNYVHVYPDVNNPDGDTISNKLKWVDAVCEHCNSNRHRKETVLLKDVVTGQYKLVGSTCLKEFTGIDAWDIISALSYVDDIYMEEAYLIGSSSRNENDHGYVETLEYLAHAIQYLEENNYVSGETKEKVYNLTKEPQAELGHYEKAKEIIDFYTTFDMDSLKGDSSFHKQIRFQLRQEYCKANGHIAYAPIGYKNLLDIIERQKQQEAEKAEARKSSWQGDLGDKISRKVDNVSSFSFEGMYGTTWVHKFKDEVGNIYTWFTSKSLANEKVLDVTITGTVKDHNEYDGVNETVLTRCKLA